MRVWHVLVGSLTFVVVLAVCVVLGPRWMVSGEPGLTAVDRLAAENAVRGTLLQGLGGAITLAGLAIGALLTLRQVRANRDGHAIDLFTKAIDFLASDRIGVRHGGVYALEQLSELDARYRGHTHALLTAFIRQRVPWPTPSGTPVGGGVPDDVGAALAVLGRRTMVVGGAVSELESVDLRGAELTGLDLPRVCFAHANLAGATLVGAKLADATFSDAVLREADLRNADLGTADLRGADLHGANLSGANLRTATLHGADLRGAVLSGADLAQADLRTAELAGADLRGADLSRADLRTAELAGADLRGADLSRADLRDARPAGVIADSSTTWPAGFTLPAK